MRPTLADLKRPSIVALLAANLVPLAGVLALGWDLGAVMFLFWAENAVIGLYHAVKIALVMRWLALFVGTFFALHYGMFTLVHGLFVYGMFVVGPDMDPAGSWGTLLLVAPGVLALAASHGVSFHKNFLRGGEMARMRDAIGSVKLTKVGPREWRADVDEKDLGEGSARREGFLGAGELMTAPYRRVVVMHVTIIATAFIMAFLGTPTWGIVVLVVLKTTVDVRQHLNERRRAGGESRPKRGFF